MKDQELVNALRYLCPGNFTCARCEYEPVCHGDGCAIIQKAADRIANQSAHIAALQQEIEKLRVDLKLHRCATCDFWRENDPRCMNGQSQWGGKTVLKDNYCRYWEHHTDWIPVEEWLPEYGARVLAFNMRAKNKYIGIWTREKDPGDGNDCWFDSAGWWYAFDEITHWMPLPEPPEVENA